MESIRKGNGKQGKRSRAVGDESRRALATS